MDHTNEDVADESNDLATSGSGTGVEAGVEAGVANDDTPEVRGVSIKPLKERIAEGLNTIALNSVREVLHHDPFIRRAAQRYPPEQPLLAGEDARFHILQEDKVQFHIIAADILPWLEHHQLKISTNFVRHLLDEVEDGFATRMIYFCQRSGKTREHKNRTKGGLSGKPRKRKADMKTGCSAKFSMWLVEKKLASGMVENAYCVEYKYVHNHSLGSLSVIGSRQKSAAIKATIRNLIMQGSTIQRVMQQLTMDYEKFTQIVRGNGHQLTRDDFITYDDVYNIWYQITTETMRKNDDPTLSAIKWMEEFEANNGFTYYDRSDKTNGVYFGFSSRWQLEQLKAHGRVLCFDGTHNAFG
ncbi:hypothetical protein BG011_002414, partial [Mortierella polycephala]